jgi:NADPH-dependent 2,4-dienoyl-CoA reductase/sulfur reductase-like enzyme
LAPRHYEVVVIGGGPAGMAAALKARETCSRVAILERDDDLGGILNQCIHAGFGLDYFEEELTGPEYAGRFQERVVEAGIDVYLRTMVMEISLEREVTALNQAGVLKIRAGSIVLAMGCREKTRGAIRLPGQRPAGIMTAGTAQRYMNLENLKPGRRVVILGSGDVGLIMARRMHLEGIKVIGVYELMPYVNGLARNVKQCLEDYGIPLHLSTTVVDILGQNRLSGIVVAGVDQEGRPVPGTEKLVECDTLLLSVGLIPENELSARAGVRLNPATNGPLVTADLQTNLPGVFACGNVLHVHDLVDNVTRESERAGMMAALFSQSKGKEEPGTSARQILTGHNVRYTVPNYIEPRRTEKVAVFFRVTRPVVDGCLQVNCNGQSVFRGKPSVFKPGNMQRINLSPRLLAEADGDLVLSVEEDA